MMSVKFTVAWPWQASLSWRGWRVWGQTTGLNLTWMEREKGQNVSRNYQKFQT